VKITKTALFRKVLEKLYQDYFPEYRNLRGLSSDLNEQEGDIRLAVTYLQDRGLTTERENEWRITAQGIDALLKSKGKKDLLEEALKVKVEPSFLVVGGEPKTPKTRKEMLKQRYGENYEEQTEKGKS